jgi:CTP synthase (UTP-ammonia lyase)
MNLVANVGVIGDFDLRRPAHLATNESLRHSAENLGIQVNVDWAPTDSLTRASTARKLGRFDALWASSGSEAYRSTEGILEGIRYARVKDRPFIAT